MNPWRLLKKSLFVQTNDSETKTYSLNSDKYRKKRSIPPLTIEMLGLVLFGTFCKRNLKPDWYSSIRKYWYIQPMQTHFLLPQMWLSNIETKM